MEKFYDTFIQTVKCGVGWGELPKEGDWNKLFFLAKRHGLESIFYNAIKDAEQVPDELKEAAKKQYLAQMAQQMSQEYYAETFFEALRARGIRYMPLKGYVLRSLYPIPEHRTSCDVDVFYDREHGEDIEEILTALGFTNEGDSVNHAQWTYQKTTLETHHDLAAQKDLYQAYYEDVWSRLKTEDGVRYDFTDEDFYIYFMLHGAKHFSGGGFGMRTLLDIYIYNQAKVLDRAYIQAELEKLQIWTFTLQMERLSRVLFADEEGDETTELLSEYIFQSGTYGTEVNTAIRRGLQNNRSAKKAKRAYIITTIFPPYSLMKILYPVLEKAPILLPFAWVYKWFAVLFKRRKRLGAVMRNAQAFETGKVEKSIKVMEAVGLSNE